MEDTLRERIYFHVEIISVRVLILVLMEDTLREGESKVIFVSLFVLILVLMEDTLRVRDQKTFVTWQQQTS